MVCVPFTPSRHRHAYPEPVAQVDVLFEGYLGRPDHRVASTVGLVRDGDAIVIVDPGLVPGPHSILDPLAGLGIRPQDVTDAVFSHHHPDHTLNAALFPTARFHDHWAIYQDDLWTSRDAEGFQISPAVSLLTCARALQRGHRHGGPDRGRARRVHPCVVDG
jgi:glyoxylase-like metal-dependent hydrolase (beta-lactamase superfamily II)